jgi:hypothetical protein
VSIDYAGQAGATVTVAWRCLCRGCAPSRKCRRLVVRNIDATAFEPFASREEYDRTQLGAYWHAPTDR